MSGLLAATAYAEIAGSSIALRNKIFCASRTDDEKVTNRVSAGIYRKAHEAIVSRVLKRVDNMGINVVFEAISGGLISQIKRSTP
jgi:hypothetical protein